MKKRYFSNAQRWETGLRRGEQSMRYDRTTKEILEQDMEGTERVPLYNP